MFTVDEGLVARARSVLGAMSGLRFIVGGAGTGKSTVCTALAARSGLAVVDMDARLYGSWHGRFDAGRHPVNRAWSDASDPLAWQLAMSSAEFLAFHDASTAEAMDLLADELGGNDGGKLLVDGGFGSVAVLARAVPATAIACLALPAAARATVWSGDQGRRGFLEHVAGVDGARNPVDRFLVLDAALAERMEADAVAAEVRVFERPDGEPVGVTAAAVAAYLGLA